MKRISLTLFWLACTLTAYAQQGSKEDMKVKIFTAEERDNQQFWYRDKIQRIRLSEEIAS